MAIHPLLILGIGIATVVGLILVLRLNAFLALLSAALLVSLLAPGEPQEKVSRVALAFGESTGKIGIVIALASIIGAAMMASGAADRIVRTFVDLLGQKRAPVALMSSGYVLGIPVFFDTVFYLLVPLARSLYRRTGGHYVLYLMAICAGGAVTHTLVPPTPGPLAIAAELKVEIGWMILIGMLVALPTAMAGLGVSWLVDRLMPIAMRPLAGQEEPEPLEDHELPGLFVSALPVLLPVALISTNTILGTLIRGASAPSAQLLRASSVFQVLGDANMALFLSTAIALGVYIRQRHPGRDRVSHLVEQAFMSAGVIILITAGGGAFGAMLKGAGVGPAIQALFATESGVAGIGLILLGFAISAVLKIAQGSSTVAMITTAGMLAAALPESSVLGFDRVYVATAIGAGSLFGSWMNDSGFWIYAKMGGLTESEALRSWTVLLTSMSLVGLATSILLAKLLPLV